MLGNVNCKTSAKLNLPTVLHLCSAHIMNSISYNLNKNYKIAKRHKGLVLHACGTMVKSTNIDEINIVFESMCILMTTESMLPLQKIMLLPTNPRIYLKVQVCHKIHQFRAIYHLLVLYDIWIELLMHTDHAKLWRKISKTF